jgi:hypothetical protein
MIGPLFALTAIGLGLGWLIRTARTTADDVIDADKGATAGRHLPALHPEVRDAVVPRSQAMDADVEHYRNLMPGGGGV